MGPDCGGEARRWYDEIAREVYKPAIYLKAAKALIAEGVLKESDIPQTEGYKPADGNFIDGITYDGRKPNDYLRQFKVGLKD